MNPGRPVDHTGHVIIVEDDAEMRGMLVTMLASEGFHAVAAEDGLEALHVLRAVRHCDPVVPCLVLLDLNMPRLGGLEFRRAQLLDPVVNTVPIAVPSGAVEAREWASSLKAVAMLSKPVDFDALLGVVRRYCRATRPAPSGSAQ